LSLGANVFTRCPFQWSSVLPTIDFDSEEIVIEEYVAVLISSGYLKERLNDEALGEGTVKLVIKDSDITIIGEEKLGECNALVSVDLLGCPKLTTIGKWAFNGCGALTSVVFNDALTTIGDGAFQYCSTPDERCLQRRSDNNRRKGVRLVLRPEERCL